MKVKTLLPDERVPFTEHLEELRTRLIVMLGALGVAFLICYALSDHLLELLRRPLGADLIFTSPTEALFVNIKVALLAAVFFAMPILFFQVWRFVAPGLLEKERKYLLPLMTSSTGLFLMGSAFAYLVLLPFGARFFLGYASETLKPMITVGNYFSFSIKLILFCGLTFQAPIIFYFLAKLELVRSQVLTSNLRYAVVLIFVAAAILSPPDVFTQFLMAIPLLAIYGVGILVVKWTERGRERTRDAEEHMEEIIEDAQG
ncbi:MAG: twin-arginine translocase subunit TatC [Candidatus Tectomicrobia bacterium]|uniref:Sec-independent protein translocase protein TatC n=1 Tax=Tectimicrobiota bacterium TaxID=2528274 RepID=A0A932CR31_UNCTE|nr:twin-arginine translocase subunit TatC [Candidatus Tectomicrobia bacterium]